jgi:hypothetical protein
LSRQDRLLPALGDRTQLCGEPGREDRPVPVEEFLAHVGYLHLRQHASTDPLVHDHAGRLPYTAGVEGLHRRRRAAEHESRSPGLHETPGNVSGVIAGRGGLLVGGLVLLIDDDQSEVRDGREERGAGSDGDPRLAAGYPVPLVKPLPCRKPAVQDGYARPEPGAETSDGLRGERDLRNKHDCRAPVRKLVVDGAHVDLGLPRSGDPVQKHALAGRSGRDRVESTPLTCRELVMSWRGALTHLRIAEAPAQRDPDHTSILETFDRLRDGSECGVELAHGHRTGGQSIEKRPLAVGVRSGDKGVPLDSLHHPFLHGADRRLPKRPPRLPLHGLRDTARWE